MNVPSLHETLIPRIKLVKEFHYLCFSKSAFFPQLFLHVSTFTEFCYNIAVVNSFVGIDVLEEIGMRYFFNALELGLEEIFGDLIPQRFELDDLDCNLLIYIVGSNTCDVILTFVHS